MKSPSSRTHRRTHPHYFQALEPRTLLTGVTPNDPQFSNQYALQKIDAPDAYYRTLS